MNLPWPKLVALMLWTFACVSAPAATPKAMHSPDRPKSGDAVRITAKITQSIRGKVALQYQLVDPGGYIDLADPAFQTNWVSVLMNDSGERGDATRADGVFTAELPGKLQTHRRLVRYRITVNGDVIAPPASDAVRNFAYFVYDGVPPWRGAINPKSHDPRLREPVTFGTNVMRSLPVYHFISKKPSIENTTWHQPAQWGDDAARSKYAYTGTFVADDGKVYDHVRFRARGGSWRYAMGKNMWKFDFNRGHRLQIRNDFGQPYTTRWEKLNLGACIQHGDYGRRGEQGMYEAVGFALFNLAGVEAPRTHWIHFRIIDEVEESPADQYRGDFWGLYLALEDMDDAFLKEHELLAGNLYKLEFSQPQLHSRSRHASVTHDDVLRFMAACQKPQKDSWWRSNLDLDRFYSYRSIIECIHHYDIYTGKNYFYYHNPATERWSVLPWDIDHSWGDRMHGNGQEPFQQIGLLSRAPFSIEYRNRLREIRDLLFNPAEMDPFIDRYAAVISKTRDGPGFVDADRAKWDYHPIMLSPFSRPDKAGHGRFYQAAPTKDFRGMVEMMKDYVRTRGAWIDETLLNDSAIPVTPIVVPAGPLSAAAAQLTFRASVTNDADAVPTFQWRMAEVKSPGKYEITSLWETKGTANATIPVNMIRPGRTYRVRARAQDAAGRSSHWSAPVEFTLTE